MKIKEIRDLTAEERATKLGELKQEHFNLRFQHETGQLENPKRLKHIKQDIARIYTVSREQELNIR